MAKSRSKKEFIDSLTVDELKAVASQFWEVYEEDSCPAMKDNYYFCKYMPDNGDWLNCGHWCDGCLVRYFVWKFRQTKKEAGK